MLPDYHTGALYMKSTLLLLVTMLFVSACGGEKAADTGSSAAQDAVTEIVIRPVGDQMQYETEAFTVKAGSRVRLVMDNIATVDAMQHNVVILTPGADGNAVGMAALQAGEANQYLPEDPAILFYTPLAKPGERVEVEFTAPEAGSYPFICTFPGHFGLMKGIMTVEA